ncbi:PREDICTED: clusterin-associated protein 1 homolog [Amphimedon queenslandica]|uniref:Clusterin-associated protein 1 n=1 Tax=Amphimedon queenslandica TaxID=400682 RepID=A0A1X7VNJ2_AMPQE|nr:PREDICTED: clusterin-associated protein 1 homolog [Amphimedon queenslandica]|eukprot:XP_003383332.3 PREDICTED: clusterin-associated protein 1 homolog [Amphimedon queenslandica]
MSYRELRNFTEMMQTLGYPRIISMENFREPNFTLVAEILIWLIQRYDPTAEIVTDVDTEQDRVLFIKSAAQFMSTKAHIKLNTKKLYGADGYAVKELLKISSLLYSAMRSNDDKESKDSNVASSFHSSLTNKMTDLKACRQLASEITTKGASLYQLLGQEVDLREARHTAISRPVDIDSIEKGIERSIEAVNDETARMKQRMDNAASDEKTLEIKIEKKGQELERNQKRLKTLENVRPAFMDEYERLEGDLKQVYEMYMEKFRNLSYLEQQLEDQRKVEQDMAEERESSLLEMKMQLQQENRRTLNDTMGVTSQDSMVDMESKSRFIGNMTGEGIASDDGSASLSTGSREDEDPLQDMQEEEEDEEEEEEEDDEERREFAEGDSDEDF